MPDIREEFEAWADSKYSWLAQEPDHNTLSTWNGGGYENRVVQGMWQAWQASRAALRVELPPTITAEEVVEHFNIDEEGIDMAAGIAHMVNGAIAACAAFIKKAGIEVKHG